MSPHTSRLPSLHTLLWSRKGFCGFIKKDEKMPSTSKPGQTEFVCFPCACLGSLGELQLHPQSKNTCVGLTVGVNMTMTEKDSHNLETFALFWSQAKNGSHNENCTSPDMCHPTHVWAHVNLEGYHGSLVFQRHEDSLKYPYNVKMCSYFDLKVT